MNCNIQNRINELALNVSANFLSYDLLEKNEGYKIPFIRFHHTEKLNLINNEYILEEEFFENSTLYNYVLCPFYSLIDKDTINIYDKDLSIEKMLDIIIKLVKK